MQTVGQQNSSAPDSSVAHSHDRVGVDGTECQASHEAHQPLPGNAARHTPDRKARLALPIGLGAIALGGCIAVAAANPGDQGVELCWSRSVFGVDCPFCGGLRATNSLLRGNLAAAADHNVVLAVAMPVAVMMWVWWTVKAWRGDNMSLSARRSA